MFCLNVVFILVFFDFIRAGCMHCYFNEHSCMIKINEDKIFIAVTRR